jgi:hypothetical protein
LGAHQRASEETVDLAFAAGMSIDRRLAWTFTTLDDSGGVLDCFDGGKKGDLYGSE